MPVLHVCWLMPMLLLLCAFHPADLQVTATAGCLQLQLREVFINNACSCCASIVVLQEAQECKRVSLHGSKYIYPKLYPDCACSRTA